MLLFCSEHYKASLRQLAAAFGAAQEDVEQLCEDLQWLYEIDEHCRSWTEASPSEWRGVPAYLIEVRTR